MILGVVIVSGSSSVPQIQFTDTGLVLPAEADILAGVIADTNAAFGNQLSVALDTPQGQLSSSWSAIIADNNDTFAQYVALVDPATSSGVMQDAIGQIYFMTRNPAEPTSVSVLCRGASGTIIPANTQITDIDGNLYYAVDGGTIGIDGTVTLAFANIQNGPIPCAIDSVKIYQAVTGWDSVENPAAGTLGRDVESPQEFEYRRQLSVMKNGNGSLGVVYGTVFAVANVLDVLVVQNTRNTTLNYGATNYPLTPHSLYVAVVGGDNDDIARAIFQSSSGTGADMNGNTTVTVADTSYSIPQPEYDITFNRPTDTNLKVTVQIRNSPLLPSGIIASVKAAVIESFNGANGAQRARIGGTVLASQFYAGIAAISPNVLILSVLVAKGAGAVINNSVAFGIDENPTLDASNILVSLV